MHEIKELQQKKTGHIGHRTQTAGSANVKGTQHFTGDVTLRVAQTVNTEQLQHCIPYKHGLFQVPYIILNTGICGGAVA